jgi:hypothetical protein
MVRLFIAVCFVLTTMDAFIRRIIVADNIGGTKINYGIALRE